MDQDGSRVAPRTRPATRTGGTPGVRIFLVVRSALLDILFPSRCVQCHARGTWICPECEAKAHAITPPLCQLCGREIGAGTRCQPCAKDAPRIAGIRAAYRYDGAIREAIHRLKYGGQRVLAEPLAGYLERTAKQFVPPPDALLPVPLHPSRLRERGYNQAALLASSLGQRLGIQVIGGLERVRQTEDQVRLKRVDRQENLRGAFACDASASVAGLSLLLVDDVCTTGSTLLACASALYRAKASAVWAVVVARQDYGRE